MGRRGPAPKPTPMKLLQGNAGKRAINKNEPKPQLKAPPCPAWLSPEAKREWRQLAPALERLGLLTEVDKAIFAVYCQSWAEWRASVDFLHGEGYTFETPKGYVQQRPEVAIGQRARKDMIAFGSQLGLSPASRTRISVEPSEGKSDPFEEWRQRGRSG